MLRKVNCDIFFLIRTFESRRIVFVYAVDFLYCILYNKSSEVGTSNYVELTCEHAHIQEICACKSFVESMSFVF